MKLTDIVKSTPAGAPPPGKKARGAGKSGAKNSEARKGRARPEDPYPITAHLEDSEDAADQEIVRELAAAQDALSADGPTSRYPHTRNLPQGCQLPPDPQTTRFLEAFDAAMELYPSWGADNMKNRLLQERDRFAAYHYYHVSVQTVYSWNMHAGVSADFARYGPSDADLARGEPSSQARAEAVENTV